MMPFEKITRCGGAAAVAQAARFFMRDDPVHQTLHTIAERLQDAGIPYAIVDGMALVAHGYQRTTEDVDVLVTAEGLARIHRELEGLGYLPPFAGSKNLRDASTGGRSKTMSEHV